MSLAGARALSGRDWRLFLRAAGLLLLADLGLRAVGFARVRDLLARPPRRRRAPLGSPEAIVRAVDRAARHHLYPMGCLRRALVLQRLLIEAGVPAELRFGVRKEGAGLEAHAWLEHDGRPLGEPGVVERRFAALAGR